MGNQRRPFKPEFPKPFDFVPFAERRTRAQPPAHDAYRDLSGRLDFDLYAETFVHVSSGTYALAADLGLKGTRPLRDHYRVTVDGVPLPAVPGSTLKGATRAVIEAVTASCIGVTRARRDDLPKELSPACKPPTLCPACALFGAMSRLGRVAFHDAVFVDGQASIYGMPPLFRPRPEDGRAYHDAGGRFVGRKFYFHGRMKKHSEGMPVEVLVPPTRLSGWLSFTSLSAAELGLLMFGLGLDGSFRPALGAGKPVAMGRVRVQPTALTLYQTASLTSADPLDERLTGDTLATAVTTYLAAAEGLILGPQRDKLREVLDPDNPRDAPTGTY